MYRKSGKPDATGYDSAGNGLNDGWGIYYKPEDAGAAEQLIAIAHSDKLADTVLQVLNGAAVGDAPCYFKCEHCDSVQTCPTSDVKEVGRPMCCDTPMDEIELNEYEQIKAKPFLDIDGERYGEGLVYHQAVASHAHIDKDGKEWPSYAVWLDLAACQALFPDQPLKKYIKDQIEEPWFVDKPTADAAEVEERRLKHTRR